MKELLLKALKSMLEKKKVIAVVGAIVLALIASALKMSEVELKELVCGQTINAVQEMPDEAPAPAQEEK